MVYTGRASDFHPIAMDRVDGKVVIDPGRVNVAREYDSKRILPKSQQVSVRQIRKHNFEVVKDFNLDPDSAYIYYDYDENYDSEA